jgi:hypothetical protein
MTSLKKRQCIFDECVDIYRDYIDKFDLNMLSYPINIYLTILGIREVSIIETFTKPLIYKHSKLDKYILKNNNDDIKKLRNHIYISQINNSIINLANKYNCETMYGSNDVFSEIFILNPSFTNWKDLMICLQPTSDLEEIKRINLGLAKLLGYSIVENWYETDLIVTIQAIFLNNTTERKCNIFGFKINKMKIPRIKNITKMINTLRGITYKEWKFKEIQVILFKLDKNNKKNTEKNMEKIEVKTYN